MNNSIHQNNNTNTSEFAIKLIKELIINNLKELKKNGQYYISLFFISQIIEVLGAFIDDKPFRAREQSKKRFNLALRVLFPPKYARINSKDWLYSKFRSHYSHFLFPSAEILLVSKSEMKDEMSHLEKWNDKIIICSDYFIEDTISAANIVLMKIHNKDLNISDLPKFEFYI
jgi:hypothetical protein